MSTDSENREVNEIRIPKSWDTAMQRELLELYFDGMDIEMLGCHFSETPVQIYKELSSLLFGVSRMHEDPDAPRFRKRWEALEDGELRRLYRRSLPIEAIAIQLGRDVPGVAMRLINSWWATCPPQVAERLGLNEDDIQIAQPFNEGKICSDCLDVWVYCKCWYEKPG